MEAALAPESVDCEIVELRGQLVTMAVRAEALSILMRLGLALVESEIPGFCSKLLAGLREAPRSETLEGMAMDKLVLDHIESLVEHAVRIDALSGGAAKSH